MKQWTFRVIPTETTNVSFGGDVVKITVGGDRYDIARANAKSLVKDIFGDTPVAAGLTSVEVIS